MTNLIRHYKSSNETKKEAKFSYKGTKFYRHLKAPDKSKQDVFYFINIYLTKGASCNSAGDGPKTQWDVFVKSGIIVSTDIQHILVGMNNQGCGDCFFYSILQMRDLRSTNIVTVHDLRFAIWYYVVNHQNELCKEIYDAFRPSNDNDTYQKYIERIKKTNEWVCSTTIIITSIFLQTDIILIKNEINSIDGTIFTELFKTSTALKDKLHIESIFFEK